MSYDDRYSVSKQRFIFAETFTALAANADRIIRTPAASSSFFGCWVSLSAKVTNAGSVTLQLFDGSSGTNGSQLTPLCTSRLDTPAACPVTLFVVTVPTDGTQLNIQAGSLSQPAVICGYILKPASNYIVRVAPTNTPTGVLTFDFKVAPTFNYLYIPE